MKLKNFVFFLSSLLALVLFTQCEKGPTAEADAPEWAGGFTEINPHINTNDESGTTRGGDYGDLYVLLRDLNGVPVMLELDVVDEEGVPTGETFWVVQPIGADSSTLELDAEGELTEASVLLAQPVDFGRLNIVRSPQSVLDQALDEALKVINAGEKFSLDFCGRLSIWNTDLVVDSETYGTLIVTKTIDSPRENMALYQEIMNYGFNDNLTALIGTGIDPLMLAASCFAAGSDKTGTVTIDEVVYINGFIDCLGCDPILNEHEYDFNHDNKYYFNYGDCDCHSMFQYNRNVYKDRMLSITTLNPDGTWVTEVVSVFDAMENRGLFTFRWNNQNEYLHRVKGFAAAVDDAVQVLEFVHEDSNIEFLPEVPE